MIKETFTDWLDLYENRGLNTIAVFSIWGQIITAACCFIFFVYSLDVLRLQIVLLIFNLLPYVAYRLATRERKL